MFIKRVSGLKTNPTLIAFLIGLQLSRCPMFRIIALMVSRMHKVTFGFVIPRSAQVLLVAFPVLVSILFSSWFMLTDRTEGPTLSKAEEVSGNEDVSPKLTRVDPVKVGFVRELNLMPGKVHRMRTLSLRPALFEIEDFLTEKECNDIILMAQTVGLEQSKTLGEENFDVETNGNETNKESLPEGSEEIFKSLDSNDDGRLDTTEVAKGVIELGRVLLNEDDAEKIMSDLNMDPNKDGLIEYDEFVMLNSEVKLNEIKEYLEKIHETNSNKRTRDSSTAFLDPYEHIDFRPLFEDLTNRIHLATDLPKDMIWSSENMQVIKYEKKQHYHCHFDSEDEEAKNVPCCHLVEAFYDSEENVECVPCRFLTVFYYLNEPELGGETAFPFADNETVEDFKKSYIAEDINKCNLAEHCYDSNLYYKPKRGTALLWYNHFVSNETGWLGPVDQASFHGGCNVIEGTKWAANNWINAAIDREADLKAWELIRVMEEEYQETMKESPWEEQTNDKEETAMEQEQSNEIGIDINKVEEGVKTDENKRIEKETLNGQVSENKQ